MDSKTMNYYQNHAGELAERYGTAQSGIAAFFEQAFAGKNRIIDIGCGTGRDLNTLLEMGYDAIGIDPCAELLEQADIKYPQIRGKTHVAVLPDLKTVSKAHFDGILCSAVLMHLPEELLFDSIYALRAILKPKGRLLMSVPLPDPTINEQTHRDSNHRLFNGVTPDKFRFLFERTGFKLITRHDNNDSLGRNHRRWATMLFELEQQEGARSLDKIEAILNRDKKTATYKLALFRALAELAMTKYNSAVWLPNGLVSIPLLSVVEKWMEYYWPLFESEIFIPQNGGEKPRCKKPVAFRAPMGDLIAAYRNSGGQAAFTVQYRDNAIPQQAEQPLRQVTRMIRNTLIDGPIKYSGGEGSGTFRYDRQLQCILVPADMWRELALMGNWIVDATILRWAELTSRISHEEIKPSQVIDLLLTVPIPEREVGAARLVYDAMDDKVCVWSDKTIRQNQYEVDHAIPFSLWHNNDVWNLLPATKTANNAKRDKLPSRELVFSRKDCIIHYWEQMKDAYEHRFAFETSKFVGKSLESANNWQNSLFSAFSEAVEITAIQRGTQRWQPGSFSSSAAHFAEIDH
ncbi:MAG: methyltransferase domain-containing protein [Spartobacteria bacterium]|nr:methyltransferase domain-containing protein [Spartobacteria bacterium]